MGKYDKYKGRYKTKYADRKEYFDTYERVITPERKEYLKQYNKRISIERYRKYRSTENYKMALFIGTLIHRTLKYKNEIKVTKSTILLGWTKKEFLEKIGKSIDKHVDHKIPVSWFKENSPVSMINNLENLHLLDAKANLQKGNSFCHPVSKLYFDQVISFIKEEYKSKLIFL
jgi:hypothetical protein